LFGFVACDFKGISKQTQEATDHGDPVGQRGLLGDYFLPLLHYFFTVNVSSTIFFLKNFDQSRQLQYL